MEWWSFAEEKINQIYYRYGSQSSFDSNEDATKRIVEWSLKKEMIK
jgi:hypothetical protein